MLRSCKELRGYRLGASDGEIGEVEDLYFDDQDWAVRYLVADTGYWLPDRLVLIAPRALRRVNETDSVLEIALTRQQVEDSPPITADQPVSRQFERAYHEYYGWPFYWTGPALWGPGPYPPIEPDPAPIAPEHADPHLRSVQEVLGYHVSAHEGEVGHVGDVIVEEPGWVIRYFVIDTGHWLPGRKILIAPAWIQSVSWERSTVAVDLPRASVETAPEYDGTMPIARDYEISLFKHYSREGYWRGGDRAEPSRAA